jgi:fructan beta-fructosidase
LQIGVAVFSALSAGHAAELYREPFRPQFHFTPERNWMNDPNGLVFHDGEYHLFYQSNPFGDKWGHMSWGHAVSHDLVHWEHLPLALAEEDHVMIFSGSAVVDGQNTSGFGRNGRPPLVAIYTGHYTTRPLQNQHIAYSTDRGRTWTKHSGNPVLEIGAKDFRDPKVFWHEPTKRWVMAVSWPTERKVRFYNSPDLKRWAHLSDFGPAGSTQGIWECPDLFPLLVDGKVKQTSWVLIVNVGSGAPAGGSGCQYFVGDFDGKQFTLNVDHILMGDDRAPPAAEPALWADFGPDFYAAVSWNDLPKRDGRRIWIGWMSNWTYANDVPTAPWRNAMSIPRELVLRNTAEGTRLIQKPVRELKKLRGLHYQFKGGTINEANAWLERNTIRSGPLELSFELEPGLGGKQGVKLFKAARDELVVGVDRKEDRVYVDRTRSGDVTFHPKFSGVHAAPLAARDRAVKLHIFVDSCSIEVFVNDGEQVLTDLVFPSEHSRAVEFFGPTEGAKISALEVWALKSSWK